MSWFSSLFSSFKFPPPADSVRPQPEKRLLDETPAQASSKHAEQTSSLTPSLTTPSSSSQPTQPPASPAEIQAQGRRRNKIILACGLGFFGLSILTTRRSLARRRLASRASYFQDSPASQAEQAKSVSGALEAVEALNIATINVLSVAMMATGGALLYLDINSLADARRMIRGGIGVEEGKTEEQSNEEIEEFIASVLARKEVKEEARRRAVEEGR